MKKLLLTLIVSLAFCGSIFAQHPETHWPGFSNGPYEDQGALYASIMVNGEPVTIETENWDVMEIAAFVGDEMRMTGMFLTDQYVLEWGELFPTTNAEPIYYTTPGEPVTFKMFNHATGVEYDICEPVIWDGDGEIVTILTGEEHWEGFDDPDHPLMLNFIGEEPQTLTLTLEIEPYTGERDNYYLIAAPFGNVAANLVEGLRTPSFDFYSFDQNGDNEGKEWFNLRDEAEFELQPGVGYLYANNTGTDLTFTGTPLDGELFEKELVYSENEVNWRGWNLVGNPFGTQASLSIPFYTMNPNGGNSYIVNDEGSELPAMCGAFVLATPEVQSVTFSKTQTKTSKLNLNLCNSHGIIDRAIVSFSQGQQLSKFMFRDNSTKVYIPVDGKDYALVRSEGMGEMPVNFKAETNGTYTLNFTAEEVSFAYLHLIDNLTGADVDMLANPSYSFNARTSDYESRFKLVFATGNNSDTFAFYSNGNWVISNEGEAALQVVDVTGRILKDVNINGCASVNVNAAPGVYMIRLVNGDNVKVQKVVVR